MISFAIIGTSWITDSWIKSAESTGKWKLEAVFSRSADTAKSFADKHAISKTHTDLKELSADAAVQAVYIASPNSLHFQHAKAMLEAGKHVIMEKPACSTENELKTLFELAKSKGVMLIEAFRHIHEVNFKVLKESLGKLGPIYGASLNYASFSSRYNNVLKGETPNIFSLEFSGGSLVDIGVYPISAAVALFGAPKGATYKPFIVSTGVDGGGLILLEYDTFGVSINQSKIFTSTAPSEIYGEKGTLRLNATTDIDSVEHWDPATKQTTQLAKPKAELNMAEEAEEYAKIIDANDFEAAKALEGISLAVQKVTEGLRRDNGIVYAVERDPVEADR